MPKFFAYGTLKRGHARHAFLRAESFLADVRSRPRYQLIDLGAYPGLLRDGQTSVRGELYDVSEACLERLDEVEAVDDGLYERGHIELIENEFAVDAVTYFYSDPPSNRVDAGDVWA